jgi:hypothetical protein
MTNRERTKNWHIDGTEALCIYTSAFQDGDLCAYFGVSSLNSRGPDRG